VERVVIVDDNDAIREGFAIILRSLGKYEIVNAYPNCEAAIANLFRDLPNVVVMDLEMPGMGGIEGITKIKELKPDTEIIVITVHENLDLVMKALNVGAIGYITKNQQDFFMQLIGAIESTSNGGAPMSPRIARQFITSFQKNHKSPLTARETKVLELLSTGKSYSVIAEELFISKATVRAHIRNIYEKLKVNRKSEAIRVAIEDKLI
jgi:DNA-binding NarL/FixJ family response regulator